jgi:hypothetical protein
MLWQLLDNQVSTGINQYLHTSKVLLQTPITPPIQYEDLVGYPATTPLHSPQLLCGGISLWLAPLAGGIFQNFPALAETPPGLRCLLWLAEANGNALRIADFALPNPGVASGKHEKRTL